MKSSVVIEEAAPTAEAPTAAGAMPPNWTTTTDEDGYTYFWNTKTNEVAWELPEVLDEGHATQADSDSVQAQQRRALVQAQQQREWARHQQQPDAQPAATAAAPQAPAFVF